MQQPSNPVDNLQTKNICISHFLLRNSRNAFYVTL